MDDFSSKLDLHRGLETVESIGANHMEMARCSNKDDQRYQAIARVLRQFARKKYLKNEPTAGEHACKEYRKAFSKQDGILVLILPNSIETIPCSILKRLLIYRPRGDTGHD